MKKVKIIDLFSGIGGFRLAAENYFSSNNIKTEFVAFSEIDKYAAMTYKTNFKTNEEKYIPDITILDNYSDDQIKKLIPSHDILFAGFPCQPFSIMGKQKAFADPRGTLFFYIKRIIETKKPKYILLENVKRIKTIQNGLVFNTIIKSLDELDYNVYHWILDSKDYGVPQTRRRLFFLAIRKDIKTKKDFDNFPKPIYNKKSDVRHILEKKVHSKYYLSDRIKKTILANGSKKFYSKSEINPVIARPLTRSMHKMHRACQDNYYSDSFIAKSSKGGEKIRKITPLEAFRLQGFPDSFVFNAINAGLSDSQLYMQAGNAVTVPVVESILAHVFETK